MKKTLVVVGEYFPPRLGGGCRLFEILRKLAHKYDIRFLTVPPSYVTFIRKIESDTGKKNEVFRENMVGYRIELPSNLLKLWRTRFLIPFMLTMTYLLFMVLKKLIELKPDIIIIDAPSPYSGLLGVICGRILRKKLLVEYNDMQALYAVEMLENKPNVLIKNVLMFIEDRIVKSGWKVTGISNFIERYATSRGRRDVVVIPNGVDLQIFDPKTDGTEIRKQFASKNKTKLCVFTGRIEACAGARMILDTARLLQERDDITFLIVGEGDFRLMKDLSRLNNVVLAGLVPKENVPKYLAAADIILVPFSSSVASHAISPLKLFEALAMGKPVISSDISGVKEVITNNYDGILVASSLQNWACAIVELIDNPAKALLLGRNARRTAQKYSWDRLSIRFDEVIDSCMPLAIKVSQLPQPAE